MIIEKIKYPKLIILCLCILAAYVLSKTGVIYDFSHFLNGRGYISAFLAGMMFAYGFSAPIGVAIFLSIASGVNVFIAAIIGGMGALVSDLIIFHFIKVSFLDEFTKLKSTRVFQIIHGFFHEHLSDKIKGYVLWVFAGILIASPLPDEIGISLISGFTEINKIKFSIASFALNTLGILVIMAIV